MHLGIDIGGTKIRGVLLSRNSFKPKRFFSVVFPRSKKGFLVMLEREVKNLVRNERVTGVGVGLPGVLDYKRGVLVGAGNLPFLKNWDAKKFFSRYRPVKIDNDSRCFVRAEAKLGAGRGYKNIVGLAIGTGIGGAVIEEGKMHYGVHGREGEVGHMVLELGTSNHELRTLQGLGAKRAYENRGDRSKIIGAGVANVIHAYDPEIIILGGGGGLSKEVDIKTVRKVANSYLRPELRRKTKIVKGKLGEYAGAIGAAMLAAGIK